MGSEKCRMAIAGDCQTRIFVVQVIACLFGKFSRRPVSFDFLADREQFITRIREGGIAAMELVARDLKATGLYIARALSFTGVEYDILQHELTPNQIEIYDQYADAWSIIHQNLEDALEITGIVDPIENTTLNSMAKAAARSRFESCKQRFFGQVLLSFKLETLIPEIDRHLAQDESVVVQIVTTAEAVSYTHLTLPTNREV